jgi:hypothetical protein
LAREVIVTSGFYRADLALLVAIASLLGILEVAWFCKTVMPELHAAVMFLLTP